MLAIIVSGYPDGRERTRALSLFTAVMMGGGSLGLVLGGVITQWASWRWVLFINVPIGIAVLLIGPRFIAESKRQPGRLDLAGALTSTAGHVRAGLRVHQGLVERLERPAHAGRVRRRRGAAGVVHH